jgi:hypothetical protein
MEKVVKTDKSQKTWVILGTKRGGTSFLAQILGENGVKIDTCGNGHNEDIDFVMLNVMILKDAGGDWNNLAPDEAIGEAVKKHEDHLKQIIADKKASGQDWGWKDPRQGATLKHILPYLDDDVYIVAVFRKPEIAAKSMQRTWPQHSLEFCRKVIDDYYERILDALEEFTR